MLRAKDQNTSNVKPGGILEFKFYTVPVQK